MAKKILLLSDINSAHTRKWAEALAERGLEIGIFSLRNSDSDWFKKHKNISILSDSRISAKTFHKASIKKFVYLKLLPKLKKVIKEFKPDILHAHYATSYGLLGRLSGFHPFFISCWGSDVMNFPNRGFFQKSILKSNLKSADKILATSQTIEKYIHKIINKKVIITPFGIDTAIFKPMEVQSVFDADQIVIGAIKSLEKIYCIDILIRAFAELKKKVKNIKLLIVGEGTQRDELATLANQLQIEKDILFTGKIAHNEIPAYHNMIDIFVNISEYESFGVSVLEAMACAKPVVVTDTGGLNEIIQNDSIGFKIPVKDIQLLVSKLLLLIADKELRSKIGNNARQYVLDNYNWKNNLEIMISEYEKIA